MTNSLSIVRAAALALLGAAALPILASDIYVQQGVGNDANAGDAWGAGRSLATIGRALTKADRRAGPDTIHVAAGTYVEQLAPRGDVTLLGSYPPDGVGVQDRVATPSIIDGSGTGIPLSIGGVSNVLVDRFVVRNGHNAVAGNGIGGGISVVYASGVTLTRNRVEASWAQGWGGGIGIHGSTGVVVSNNSIAGNQAVSGGGVGLSGGAEATLQRNTLRANIATQSGGGLAARDTSLVLTRNQIRDNQADDGGGVAWFDCQALQAGMNTITGNQAVSDGGGILHSNCTGSLRENMIQRNRAGNWGGGICLRTLARPTQVRNNLITDNRAGGNGGGISLYDQSSAPILNNTIARNRAVGFGGGLFVDGGTTATVRNSILWANASTAEGEGGNDQITDGGSLQVSYSDIALGWPGVGNLNVAPGFQLVDDYRLISTSACKDVASASTPPIDLVGVSRPQGAGVDMGAYEWIPGPDLTGGWRSLTVAPGGLSLEGAFRVRNSVVDQNAGRFRVDFYLSDDGKTPVGNRFATSTLDAGLAGSTGETLRFQSSFPASVVGRYVLAVVDNGRQVPELSERNNGIAALIVAP